MARSAVSGRRLESPRSNSGSPTAPSRIPFAARAAPRVSPGSGSRPRRNAAPPIKPSRSSNWWLKRDATDRNTAAAAVITSGPMPSPGNRRMDARKRVRLGSVGFYKVLRVQFYRVLWVQFDGFDGFYEFSRN
jgi:hypothetical protein